MPIVRKAKTMNIIISCTIADNQGSATVDRVLVEGAIEDTASVTDKQTNSGKTDTPAWDGAKRGNVLVSDCLADFKRVNTIP